MDGWMDGWMTGNEGNVREKLDMNPSVILVCAGRRWRDEWRRSSTLKLDDGHEDEC